MRHFITALLIFAGAMATTTQVDAQKIGYVNTDDILALMPEAATMQSQLQTYQQSLYQNAADKQTAFNESVDKFVKDSATMNASLKEVKRKELQKQSVEINNLQQEINQDMESKRQELAAPILKKLQDAIDAVAKENGYTYVVAREALIVVPDKDNLASLVIKKLGLKQPQAPLTSAPAASATPNK